jgi:hypothetical protein
MNARKRLAATVAAAAATLAVAVPAGASAAPATVLPHLGSSNSNVCLPNVVDPGPLGPMGPYGAAGPYGPNGPLSGQANPLGDVASCGGALTYILRGGTINSFVQSNLQSAGQH